MQDFAIAILSRAVYECTFMDLLGMAFSHSLSVIHAAHGAELVVKARIAQEHPLLIFDNLPKSKTTKDLLTINDLYIKGRTIDYSELPERLWSATGIRMPNPDKFIEFGRHRNTIMHFAVPAEDWAEITLRFMFDVIEPMVEQFWQRSIIEQVSDWDDAITSDGYLSERLAELKIQITPLMKDIIAGTGYEGPEEEDH